VNVNRDELLNLCKTLISIPSVTGQEKKLVDFIAVQMRNWGFDQVKIDKYGSIIGVIKGTGTGKSVLFDAHLDTVGVSDNSKWLSDPFKPYLKEGKLYGRGAADMKGALAAMLIAAKHLAQDKPLGDIYVVGTVAEEPAEGISLINVLQDIKPDHVIIGEATSLRINIGQRGRGEVLVEAFGKSAHSSNPHVGENAVYFMLDAVTKIKNMQLSSDKLLGDAIMELTDIISYPYPGFSVIPNYCKVTYDRRLLVGETPETVVKEISELINPENTAKFKVSIAQSDFTTYTGERLQSPKFAPAWKQDPDSLFVKKAEEALKDAGLKPVLGAYSFCTNGSGSAGLMYIPTIGFGPGNESEAHVDNEWIEFEQVVQAARGYWSLAKHLAQ
jgi:putative selenium metabolism hydrolase